MVYVYRKFLTARKHRSAWFCRQLLRFSSERLRVACVRGEVATLDVSTLKRRCVVAFVVLDVTDQRVVHAWLKFAFLFWRHKNKFLLVQLLSIDLTHALYLLLILHPMRLVSEAVFVYADVTSYSGSRFSVLNMASSFNSHF